MENIPMKVATKTMAFTDHAPLANDRVTAETSIIAFRATAHKHGKSENANYDYRTPGI